MKNFHALAITVLVSATPSASTWAQTGDATRGERMFRACAACHSLEPNRHMTGPSLAELWNRRAGAVASFDRYSPALKSSGIIWEDSTLDAWVADPQHFIPGNTMTFPGVKDARQRADLLAFLKDVTRSGYARSSAGHRNDQSGGMMGMGGGAVPKLRKLESDQLVQKITHCRDTYRVSTADGKLHTFWERNLRFKTDVSEDGPQSGSPAIVGAGMMGDRADVIFAAPEEISSFILAQC